MIPRASLFMSPGRSLLPTGGPVSGGPGSQLSELLTSGLVSAVSGSCRRHHARMQHNAASTFIPNILLILNIFFPASFDFSLTIKNLLILVTMG